jgi:putative N6-adenine-specific DNA methylase
MDHKTDHSKGENFEMLAKTLFGFEDILSKEIESLGGKILTKENRAVRFTGDKKILYKVNYHARTALRVLRPLFVFNAENEKELYKNILEYPWDKVFGVNQTFAVNSVVYSPFFKHSHYVALKVKDAIVDRFRKDFGIRPSVNTTEPDVPVNIHLSNNRCTVSLDSSGDSLHKRGYRMGHGVASLNEVLAAGLISLTGYDGSLPFIDPMCGSGTLVIEAALIAYGISPGSFGRKYSFQNWLDYDDSLFEKISKEGMNRDRDVLGIFGSDISDKQIRVARMNVYNAGLMDKIKLKEKDMEDLHLKYPDGIMLINPPYGERIRPEHIDELYSMIGNTLKRNFHGYTAWVFSGNPGSLKKIGLHPSEKYLLYNSEIKCQFRKFELYQGSKKASKTGTNPTNKRI